MAFNKLKYQRDLVITKMKSHAILDDEDRIRKIRGVGNGISYEVVDKGVWTTKKFPENKIAVLLQELE